MNTDDLPFSQACDNNKGYILDVLRDVFAASKVVLEIASGTGQHACHFAANLPQLQWQPTELPANLRFLTPRCATYGGDNLLPEQALNVFDNPWPVEIPDATYTANSFHIMPYAGVEAFFRGMRGARGAERVLAVYGPFNYSGSYTSASNARFDEWLKQQHAESGIRDFEKIVELAVGADLDLYRDCEMPANNRLLVFKSSSVTAAT